MQDHAELNAERLLRTVLEPAPPCSRVRTCLAALTKRYGLRTPFEADRSKVALGAAASRASAQTPALAELVRKEQDLHKQISAQKRTAKKCPIRRP